MRRLAGLLALAVIAWLLRPGFSAGQSAEWWSTGSWEDGRFLHFIDAASVRRPTPDVARFSALAYYPTPWIYTNRPTGERRPVAYEKFTSAFDCRDHRLNGRRFLFGLDEQLFAADQQDPYEAIDSPLTDAQYAFACLGERAGGPHDFRPIFGDPVAYSRLLTKK